MAVPVGATQQYEARVETRRGLSIAAADPNAVDDVLALVIVEDVRSCWTVETTLDASGAAVERVLGEASECGREPAEGARVVLLDSGGARASEITDGHGEATFSLGVMAPADVPADLRFVLEDGASFPAARVVSAIAERRARRARERAETEARAVVSAGELRLAGLPVTGATPRAARRACETSGAAWAEAADARACVISPTARVSFEFEGGAASVVSYVANVSAEALVVRAMLQAMQGLVRLYGHAIATDGPARDGEAHQARWELLDAMGARWRLSVLTTASSVVVRYARAAGDALARE